MPMSQKEKHYKNGEISGDCFCCGDKIRNTLFLNFVYGLRLIRISGGESVKFQRI